MTAKLLFFLERFRGQAGTRNRMGSCIIKQRASLFSLFNEKGTLAPFKRSYFSPVSEEGFFFPNIIDIASGTNLSQNLHLLAKNAEGRYDMKFENY